MPSKNGLVKVIFEVGDREEGHTESVWAKPEGEGRYKLCNSPFYVYGVSFEDVVFAKKEGESLLFTGVAATSGHSTYRIVVSDAGKSQLDARLSQLNGLGCTYEGGPFLALDVPPESDIHHVYKLLEEGEHDGLWEFEEGHCGHPAITQRP